MADEPEGGVVYRQLQAWSRPHLEEGIVTVHFQVRDHPEQRFKLAADAARDLAVQLMRHSKRVRAGKAVQEERHDTDR